MVRGSDESTLSWINMLVAAAEVQSTCLLNGAFNFHPMYSLGKRQAELLNRFSNTAISFLKNFCPQS